MGNKVYLNYDSTYVFNLICLLIELGKLTPQRMGFTRRYLWIYSLYSLCVRGDDLNKTCDKIIQLYDIQEDLQWHILTTRPWAISTHSALHYRIWLNKKNCITNLTSSTHSTSKTTCQNSRMKKSFVRKPIYFIGIQIKYMYMFW